MSDWLEGGCVLELALLWVSTRHMTLAAMWFCGVSLTLPLMVAGLSMSCCWLQRMWLAIVQVDSEESSLGCSWTVLLKR